MRTNARISASKIVHRAWNLPPGMRPGDESSPEPDWYGSSVTDVYESADADELDRAMREAIHEDADLPNDQVEELMAGDYYSPVSVELGWDSAKLEFHLKPSPTKDAPERLSVTIRNPFVD